MDESKKINLEEWEIAKVTGGFNDAWGNEYRTVTGTRNYLALRREPNYDGRNEIARLDNGDVVEIKGARYQGPDGNIYIYVYSPRFRAYGFVNENYLVR